MDTEQSFASVGGIENRNVLIVHVSYLSVWLHLQLVFIGKVILSCSLT